MKATRKRAGGGGANPPLQAVLGRGDLGGSLLYVFPLFVVYGVGVLFAPSMNGVDFVTRHLFAAVGYDTTRYLLVYGGLTAVFVFVLAYMKKRGLLHRLPFVSLLLESTIVALTLGSFLVFVMRELLGMGVSLEAGGLPADIVMSFGAGVHEELVFRLGLFAGGAALLRAALGASHGLAMVISGVASSLLFSAAHHVGPLGDPWSADVFVYRALAGGVFAALFYFRSLAHAVYAHALYDVYVSLWN